MKLPVILGSLVLASTAYAQAPGEYGEGGFAPPSMAEPAPIIIAPAPQPLRRWSVGFGVGSLELAPHVSPDSTSYFDIGSFYVRYRLRRHFEFELAVGGGSESEDANGNNGGRDVSSAVLALRYRFNPQRRWNWWLMAGMGALSVTRKDATDEERESASQSTLQLGVGIERRWSRFALQFEVRAVGVAGTELDDEMTIAPVGPNGMPVAPPYDGDGDGRADNGMAGGQFVFSGNYYF